MRDYNRRGNKFDILCYELKNFLGDKLLTSIVSDSHREFTFGEYNFVRGKSIYRILFEIVDLPQCSFCGMLPT